MAALLNGRANGSANGYSNHGAISNMQSHSSKRFSDIPAALDIPVQIQQEDDDQAVEVDLLNLLDDPTELCTMLENEGAARTHWMTISLAYAKQRKVDHAIEIVKKGLVAIKGTPKEQLSMLSCLCWLYLWKSREAPRVPPEGQLSSEAKTKEHYLQQSTTILNEASRLNPSFPPLFLARGVLYLLKASLQPPSKTPGANDSDRSETLRFALKSFEDAIRVSQRRNMMAVIGKSRALYSLGKWAEALEGYQEVLGKMPDLIDPDPRIGIGACFWQLGYKDDAKMAWERSLEINPESKIANILLGLYYLDASSHVPTNGHEFISLYKKAMTEYTQRAFKADKDQPLTCATFASYFLSRKSMANVNTLAHKAIQYTDVNAIASDGWYLLARVEHYQGNLEAASDYYRRADEARGGAERGFLPAKFGAAQLSVLKNDFGEAKLRLEKSIQQSKNIEAMTLLGALYAEEVFANQYANVKEDKSVELKKAIGFLEHVRNAWKDSKKNLTPDTTVLLNLARLYEIEQPEKSLICLEQVEQMEIDQVPEEDRPQGLENDAAVRGALRETLPPQLLNNMGCFQYKSERFEQALQTFQAALSACVKVSERQEGMDTDALVTTISYNLGRTYEASGMLDEAIEVYKGVLIRRADYTDAETRLAYISLRRNPADLGPKAIAKLYSESSSDVEVRAMYGWYLGRVQSRKRPSNVLEDPELRHYKHTLQNYEKHDRYALIGMGNVYLTSAREMRRETESDKQKRSAVYTKAVEFFDKALQLDPKNAYAAQGVAICLIEDKKDFKNGLGILIKARDTIKDPSIYVNLGHIFSELRQYTKAIEHYEVALSKDRGNDTQILACLGRTWLIKARAEKDLESYKHALDYSQKALEVAPEQIHFKFNVAFVQIQLATMIYSLAESQRTLAAVQDAADGLEQAIESLGAIAQHPQTPYPKHDVEQRANMAKNTMRRQLERSIQAQKEYEEKNAEKIKLAMEQREAERRRKQEAVEAAAAAEAERKRIIAGERERIAEQDREIARLRADETRARDEAEFTEDSAGEKVKRKKKTSSRRKKKSVEDSEADGTPEPKRRSRTAKDAGGSGSDSDLDEKQPKKRRKLAKKDGTAAVGKYKSSEIVVESDSDGEGIGGGGMDHTD